MEHALGKTISYCGTNWLVGKMRSTDAMPLDHMDKITCQLPQLNLMKRHVSKLPTSRDMIKLMKEGELLELEHNYLRIY